MAWRQRDRRASAAIRRILPAARGLVRGCRGFAQRAAWHPRWPQDRAAPQTMDLSPCLHWVRTRLWRHGARQRRFCSKCCVLSPCAPAPFSTPVPSPLLVCRYSTTQMGPSWIGAPWPPRGHPRTRTFCLSAESSVGGQGYGQGWLSLVARNGRASAQPTLGLVGCIWERLV